MREFIDDIGNKVIIPDKIERVISLCPSITETIFDLDAGDLLVGKTDYCIYPSPEVLNLLSVGKTLNADIKKIRELKPGLVIASKDENNRKNVEEIAKEFPVFTFEISTFNDAVAMIPKVGELLDKAGEAYVICGNIMQSVKKHNGIGQEKNFFYFVWKNPWMLTSKQTFISDHLAKYGFKNLIDSENPYSQFSDKELQFIEKPDIIFLPSEPYEFSRDDKKEMEKNFPNSKVVLVKGEMICWYGSRMRLTGEYLKTLNL